MILHSFDVRGRFAHFRKYYANNTAMSFTLPPATTIMGMVASILGLARDSYYEVLGPERVHFGIGLRSPIKKTFHRLNLLKVEADGDLRGRKGRVQIPFEVVSAHHPRQQEVVYRIYVGGNAEQEILHHLAKALQEGKRHYQLSLGTANFMAQVVHPRLFLEPQKKQGADEFISFHSAVKADRIRELDLSKGKIFVEEDMMPAAFVKDHDREVAAMHRVLYATDGQAFRAKIEGDYLSLGESENFTLLRS